MAPRAAESAGDHDSKQGTAFLAPPNTAATGRSVAREVAAGTRLTEAEHAARMRAFEVAWNDERRRQAEQQAEEQRRAEAEAAARHAAEEEAKRQAEAAAKLAAEQAARRTREETRRVPAETDDEGLGAVAGETENRDHAKQGNGALKRRPGRRERTVRPGERRFGSRAALDDEDGERGRSLASVRRRREKLRGGAGRPASEKVIRDVVVPDTITVRDLALRMAEPAGSLVKALITMGERVSSESPIDADTAELLVAEFGHRVKRTPAPRLDASLRRAEENGGALCPRPPVVTVMGHVDHGKTSLLDALRKAHVAAQEVGGITQHIGAYRVKLASGDTVTFIDTPGHAAFSKMRGRGADLTDIVVLVVAADDGVMEQTIESIRHARAANVPIVVAINKIDLPRADPERVKRQLLNHGVAVEQMGGDVLAVEISAKAETNLDKLLEAILLQAELLDLKANPEQRAEGVVLEAKLERGRGPVATLLVQRGTLREGETVVAGCECGRVRALLDERGERIEQAGPSVPVEVLGLSGTPNAGDGFAVFDNEESAREISMARQAARRAAHLASCARPTYPDMLAKIKGDGAKELPLVIKADARGSIEAITATVGRIANDEVGIQILHAAVGGVNESDVSLASASGAAIVAFNVRPTPQAHELAKREGVGIRTYSIIYELVEDVRIALNGLLAPVRRERPLGYADVRKVFSISGVGTIAGCMVTEGVVQRGAGARLLRDAAIVRDGQVKTLRRFKDDVSEVKAGYECGIALAANDDIRVGDRIACYAVEEVARSLAPVA